MISELYKIYVKNPSVTTDTRNLNAGDLFFALKGPNFNGNQYARKAIESGSSFAIIDEKEFEIDGRTILVPDALEALQQLALHHRRQFAIPFLAITGSNGKTTTKELIHAVLSTTFKTYTTAGNLNNHIGVPLTLLKIRPDAEIAVIEMGANHQKEIAGYCKLALPNYGIITNCGKAHLEGFGGVEGVKKGKGELYDFLRKASGTAFVMWDYDYLRQMSEGIQKVIRYGTTDAELEGTAEIVNSFLEVTIKKGMEPVTIHTRLAGDYNLSNVLAAVTVGKHFEVSEEKIIKAIENYFPSNSRSQWMEKGGNRILLDAYNANPSSMKLAIENFARLDGNNKVLFLGAMAELGEESLKEHQAIIDLIKEFSWQEVVLVGGDFMKLDHGFRSFKNPEEVKQWLSGNQFINTHILIKGSRSQMMEKIIED